MARCGKISGVTRPGGSGRQTSPLSNHDFVDKIYFQELVAQSFSE
jgi:hypothetical protein